MESAFIFNSSTGANFLTNASVISALDDCSPSDKTTLILISRSSVTSDTSNVNVALDSACFAPSTYQATDMVLSSGIKSAFQLAVIDTFCAPSIRFCWITPSVTGRFALIVGFLRAYFTVTVIFADSTD